jgi:hypothetical protein
MQSAKSIEVYTPGGALLFKAIVTDINIAIPEVYPPSETNFSKPEKGNGNANGESMSEAQKKLLFRLVASVYKLDGDQIFEKIKELFGTKSLKPISKKEASKMIEHLLEKEREGHT